MNYSKRLMALLLLTTSLACTNKNVNNNDIEKSKEYNIGNIYIGNQEYIDNLDNIKENDFIVLDERDAQDPNIKIYNSYRIVSFDQMDIILNEIMNYEKNDPSNWNRSLKSMKLEWFYHNMSYYLDYKIERTKDVDLNNADENTYYIKKLIR